MNYLPIKKINIVDSKTPQKIVLYKIKILVVFKQDICLWCDGQHDPSSTDLLCSIKQNIRSVRSIVEETSCLKLISSTPPRRGKLTIRDRDPFDSVLNNTSTGVSYIPIILEMIDEAIKVLNSPRYLNRLLAISANKR